MLLDESVIPRLVRLLRCSGVCSLPLDESTGLQICIRDAECVGPGRLTFANQGIVRAIVVKVLAHIQVRSAEVEGRQRVAGASHLRLCLRDGRFVPCPARAAAAAASVPCAK